ncbi:MAG: MlaD family protein [Cytophagales bacterium]|nr:MlaD family protein [Cytophagales bacterium]
MKLSKEVKVGLLATIALTSLYLGFNFLKGRALFSSRNTYYVIYDSSEGLAVSNPVIINGFSVGIVKDIKLLQDEDFKIIVAFEVKKEIKVTDATIAKLISSSLWGGKAIELIISKAGNPLQNHDTIPGAIEKDVTDIFKESAVPVLKNANATILLLNDFITNLSNNKEEVNATFSNLEEATRRLKEIISVNQGNFNTISKNLAKLSTAFFDEKNGLTSLLAKLNRLAGEVEEGRIKKMVEKLSNMLAYIEEALGKANEGEGTLGKLLYNDSLYTNLNNTLADLDKLLIDLRENPKRYIHFSVFGANKKNREQVE